MNYDLLREKWWSSSSLPNFNIEKISLSDKVKKEKQFDVIWEKVSSYIDSKPMGKENFEEWSKEGEKLLKKYIKNDPIFKLQYMDEHVRDGMIESTKKFINMAKEFDNDISIYCIGQATRNVWIANILQAIFFNKVEFNKAVYGYSMLYPYTDNYLDDVNVSMIDKIKFNDRLLNRLKGGKRLDITDNEIKIDKMIECIEMIFDRKTYTKVYYSLINIQEGQINSLEQQENVTIPYENDILGISIKKGSASVLVDGYLINGELSKEQEDFCLGYGFLLQIGDDLQDIENDLKNNHMTIMSQLANKYCLDRLANKLLNFTIDFIDGHSVLNNKTNLKKLIKNNCVMLILFSIVMSKNFFSEEYVNKIEEYLPFSIKYIENIRIRLEEKFKGKDLSVWK
ncbi:MULTISPECIES: hypothetical protein [Clostridium]|uniref:Uncharacterized protein n=1 Tax=Clostridium cibarium TaxID=2762247 RepID=A0ABR8PRB1_9CLOT|nr:MULTISPECIES: hypothetical protein [Clostridium]MBD7910713.1 hypothetical protein [Clostridium cibarium]